MKTKVCFVLSAVTCIGQHYREGIAVLQWRPFKYLLDC